MNLKKQYLYNCGLPLLLSLIIYVLFRPKNIVVNRLIIQYFINIPAVINLKGLNWAIYNLPGALWLYAFISGISFNNKPFLLSLLPLGFALGIEFLQFFHITDGTFDVLDIVFYILTWMVFITINRVFYYKDKTVAVKTVFGKRQKFALAFFSVIVILSDVWTN